MATPAFQAQHKTYRIRFDTGVVELSDLLDEFGVFEVILAKQEFVSENDFNQLKHYRETIGNKFLAFQNAYNGCIVTLQDAIDKKEVTGTYQNLFKNLDDKYKELQGNRFHALGLLAKHISRYETELSKKLADSRTGDDTDGNPLEHLARAPTIRTKPETLKPDKL